MMGQPEAYRKLKLIYGNLGELKSICPKLHDKDLRHLRKVLKMALTVVDDHTENGLTEATRMKLESLGTSIEFAPITPPEEGA